MVGVDLVQVDRLRRLLEDNPAAEAELFTERELAFCAGRRHRLAHLAARFAAKEAVLKAYGTGLGPGMRWTDVEIVNSPLGRPLVKLAGAVRERACRDGAWVAVSLSHSGDYAVAQAVLTGPPTATDLGDLDLGDVGPGDVVEPAEEA